MIRAFDGRFAHLSCPWVQNEHATHHWWIEFHLIPAHVDPLPKEERQLLLIAASLGSDELPVLIDLGQMVTGLDTPTLALVLAAMAYPGDSHEQSMFPWPE